MGGTNINFCSSDIIQLIWLYCQIKAESLQFKHILFFLVQAFCGVEPVDTHFLNETAFMFNSVSVGVLFYVSAIIITLGKS